MEDINRQAMELVGELQMIPASDAYETVKRFLLAAFHEGVQSVKQSSPTDQPNN